MGELRRTAPTLLLIAVACGGGARPPEQPAPAAPRHKVFAPLTIKQDAKAPDQAVLLGTDAQDGSTIVPIAGAPAQGLVDAPYANLGGPGPGPATAGASPVTLSAAPSTDGAVQVGGHAELSGGAGAAWRAAVWMSALAAARTLGKDPTDFTFGASPGGHVDGASASGLIAGGFVATITGARLDRTATMAGALLPDGTIGPVSGLPELFRGALAKGKKRLGYPSGLRMARSAVTGARVDLVQLARAGGAEAVEIANVRDAYRLLTGETLPEPVPVAAQEMRLDDATAQALDGKYRDWQQRIAGEWSTLLLLQQGGNLPPMLLQLARDAQARGEAAERLHKQGAIAAAYGELLEAWVLAASAAATFDVLQKVQQADVAAAVAALDKLGKLDQGALELFQQLGAMRPTTIGDHLRMMSALQAALRGWSFHAFAADEGQGARRHLEQLAGKRKEELSTPAAADALVSAVAPAIALLARSHAELRKAQHRLEDERAPTLDHPCPPPDVQRLSASLQAASAAGVSYLDALLVEPMANSSGVPLDAARLRVAMDEPDSLVAYVLAHLPSRSGLPQDLKQQWGEGTPAWSLMSLAAAELASFTSAALIAKHASLEVRAEASSGQGATALHEQALPHLLARAEHAARASARGARIATGAIPVQARLAYQQATARRAGGVGDQLDALTAYWRSSAYSQTAVMLARN